MAVAVVSEDPEVPVGPEPAVEASVVEDRRLRDPDLLEASSEVVPRLDWAEMSIREAQIWDRIGGRAVILEVEAGIHKVELATREADGIEDLRVQMLEG